MSIGRKVGLVGSIHGYHQKRALSAETIHTVRMTAIRIKLTEIHKRKDKTWVLYTGFHQTQKENQLYDILIELQNQEKQIILCK